VATEDDVLAPLTDEDLMIKPFVYVSENIPDEVEREDPSGEDEISKFDAKHREAFIGLMYLGKLSEEVTILGHKFRLETPTEEIRLETGSLHRPYQNSISSDIAWAAITVAAYLTAVDDTPLPEGIGPKDTGLRDRFNWVIANLKRVVIQRVFQECLLLDAKVDEVIAELERVGEA
jgi:hypothetical protein